MKSRAKCRLCNTIIESNSRHDLVACACGEISIDGGEEYYHASIKNDKSNLIAIDDEGNEIVLKVNRDELYSPNESVTRKASKHELLNALDEMKIYIDNLPVHASLAPITHADFGSLLELLSAILRAD